MRKYLFNFAQEGKKLILVTMSFSILSLLLYYRFEYGVFLTSFYMQTFYFLVCCFFFRDPIRKISPLNQDKFLVALFPLESYSHNLSPFLSNNPQKPLSIEV